MKEKLTIVKVSGKIIESPEALKVFIKSFTSLSGHRLVIHSGSDLASTVADRINVRIKTFDSRPIVDSGTLDVLTMVYAGLVNKQLVALLQGRKVNALGITGADLNIITSVKQPLLGGTDMGSTGEVRQVNAQALSRLIDGGVTPVIAPLTHDGKGNLLFNETDAMAAEVAKALAHRYNVTLIYCFKEKGVLLNIDDPDSVVAELKRTRYKAMREMDIIKDWFVNKLDNAFSAIDHGVSEVIITNATQLAKPNLGTHIR
ncbi:MAG: acetylglutamate kinase [Muribaculaceae bacterium]|nr:acetylglutamate kinase [Muribaculaceae bacterium]